MPQEPLHIEDVADMLEGQRVLRLNGPILISNFFPFQALVRANTSRSLILDLTQVPYIDSAGLGVLIGAFDNHQEDSRSLVLLSVVEVLRNIMPAVKIEQF